MTEFQIHVTVEGDGLAILNWGAEVSPSDLERAVSAAADDALLGRALRRLEVSLPVDDRIGRRAVLRAGFRQEGIRRQAFQRADGEFSDVALYARLASDQVHGPDGFSGVMNSALPRTRAIAHVLFRAEDGRVLLCDTVFKNDWELPGGIVERGEAPHEAAVREVEEELGRRLPIGQLLVVDWMPPYLGWDDALEFIFDGGVLTDQDISAFSLQPSEIKSVSLVPVAEAARHLTPISHRRLSIAAALGAGQLAYLENGREL